MVALLLRHGVELGRATTSFEIGYTTYPAGTIVIPAAQPYRPFLLTMLRAQRYPEVRPSVNGPIIEPYDVASWSLPLTMGVDVVEADTPLPATFDPIAAADWPRTDVTVEHPAGTVIPAGADTLYTAVNRLLADGSAVARVVAAGDGFAVGDLWIDHREIDRNLLAALADELDLPTIETRRPPAAVRAIEAERIGLFKPWVASMDEGWTRWVLERYDFPMVNLSNEQIRSGEFADTVDVLIFPDVEPGIIAEGVPEEDPYRGRFVPLPPEYSGGIDVWQDADDATDAKRTSAAAPAKTTGGRRIKEWVEAGGTVVALDSSTDYVIDLFDLPVTDVLADAGSKSFLCPGSTLRVEVDTVHPLGWGMRREEAVYFADSPAFKTSVPDPRFDRTVVARYPEHERDILLSGFLEGGEILERRAAAVEVTIGEGRIVLIGFRAQHRGQPLRTFKLLFNALYGVDEETIHPR